MRLRGREMYQSSLMAAGHPDSGHATWWLAMIAAVPLTGCGGGGGSIVQSSVFAQPEVIYHSGNNVGVTYFDAGVQASRARRDGFTREGMSKGLQDHRPLGRKQMTIDAVCN